MAVASFIINTTLLIIGKWRWLFFLWAFLVGFAQIYVGVHFPMDVFFGFLLGWFIGYMIAFLYKKTSFKLMEITEN
jgi:undecaprenyl-diphosphatase